MPTINQYLKSSNSQEREYSLYWLTAFGIQSVVDLRPSEDLIPIISRHIEGEFDIKRTKQEIHRFYDEAKRGSGDHHIHCSEEADLVSSRIVETFLSNDFQLSPEGFSAVHRQMFHGIYHHSGQWRERPFSKKEWVLDNASVIYPAPDLISSYLDYLFEQERSIDYSRLSQKHKLTCYSYFISKLFMINAFQYANSRAAFVYGIKYMLSRGYRLQNDTFAKEAWYFRNAIIRAFYTNMHQGIYPTTTFMEMFLGNLFHNEDNELRNHRMMIKGE